MLAQIVLLILGYELGVAATVASAFPQVPASGVSLGAFADYVSAAGGGLVAHALLGILILANALLILALSLSVKTRWFRIATFVAFVFAVSAAIGGFLFVLSGFADDSFSYQMSTGFILVLVFTFLALYLLPRGAHGTASPEDA